MSTVDGREVHLDLRLVPAALTSWGVTAAGILWSISGVIAVLLVAIAATTAAAWWGSGRRGAARGCADDGGGHGRGRVGRAGLRRRGAATRRRVRHHPIGDRYGTVAAVIVTPSETPRSLGGGRMMFRGSLQAVDADEMSGRVVVFTSGRRLHRADRGPARRVQAPASPGRPGAISPSPFSRQPVSRRSVRPHRFSGRRSGCAPRSPPRRGVPCRPTRRRCCPRSSSVTPPR